MAFHSHVGLPILADLGECIGGVWFNCRLEVVCGKARGADTFGETYAYNASIPVKEFPADWKGLGKGAGHIRNKQMGDYADALIAVWDGESRGTKNMIDYATKKGLKIHIHIIKDDK